MKQIYSICADNYFKEVKCLAEFISGFGYRVLIVDFSFERRSFSDVRNYILTYKTKETASWKSSLLEFRGIKKHSLLLIENPENNVLVEFPQFNLRKLYNENVDEIEGLREDFKKSFDFILIYGKVWSSSPQDILLLNFPDAFLFVFDDEKVDKTLAQINEISERHDSLPFDREKLLFYPIINLKNFNKVDQRIAKTLYFFSELFEYWSPLNLRLDYFLNLMCLNLDSADYNPKHTEAITGLSKNMGLQIIAAMISRNFEDIDVLVSNPVFYLKTAYKNRSAYQDSKFFESALSRILILEEIDVIKLVEFTQELYVKIIYLVYGGRISVRIHTKVVDAINEIVGYEKFAYDDVVTDGSIPVFNIIEEMR